MEYSVCPKGQGVGIQNYRDRIGWGPFIQGDQIFGDQMSMGIVLIGIVCRGVNEVGDWKSGDQLGSGPNESQPAKVCEKWATMNNCKYYISYVCND